MTGRVFIVTGASSGLGFQVAKDLCEGGNDVILACRNEEKATAAIAKIRQAQPEALATYIHLDLSCLESVQKFVEEFRLTGKQLNVLVNNAGVELSGRDKRIQYSENNFELTMGVNHLGHFLLTNLLLEDLKKSSSAGLDTRVVVVTSDEHDLKSCKSLQPLDFENLFLFKEGTYSGLQAYKNSKAASVMFTYELARRLQDSKVMVNAVFPGCIPSTDLLRNATCGQRFLRRFILDGMLKFAKITRTIQQGSAAICAVAIDDKFKEVTGKYIKEIEIEASSSEESMNQELQEKLWELSARYVHLEGYEPLDVPPPSTEGPGTPSKKGKKKEKETSSFKQKKLFGWTQSKKDKSAEAGGDVHEKKELLGAEGEKVEAAPHESGIQEASAQAVDLSTNMDDKEELHTGDVADKITASPVKADELPGHEVQVTSSGEGNKLIEVVEKPETDAVFLDAHPTDTAVEAIKADPEAPSIPSGQPTEDANDFVIPPEFLPVSPLADQHMELKAEDAGEKDVGEAATSSPDKSSQM